MSILSPDYFDRSDQYEGRKFTEDLEFSDEGMTLFLPFFCEAACLQEEYPENSNPLHMRTAAHALDRLWDAYGHADFFRIHHVAHLLSSSVDQIRESIRVLGLSLHHFEPNRLPLAQLCMKSELVHILISHCHFEYQQCFEGFSLTFQEARKEVDCYLDEYVLS